MTVHWVSVEGAELRERVIENLLQESSFTRLMNFCFLLAYWMLRIRWSLWFYLLALWLDSKAGVSTKRVREMLYYFFWLFLGGHTLLLLLWFIAVTVITHTNNQHKYDTNYITWQMSSKLLEYIRQRPNV